MSLEAFKSISEAEESADQAKIIAVQNAQKAVEEAEIAGQVAVADAISRAEEEISHLIRASDAKAEEKAKELSSNTANRQAAMRARAETRLDKAASLIVERIVNI